MKSKVFAWVFGAAISAVAATAAQAGTLDDVKQKGFVQCGVSQGLPGFSNPDSRTTGPAWTLISAAPWRLRSSTIRPR